MKIQLLPTTFDENACATAQQHLSCLVFDDCVAVDAGSLATAASKIQREKVRNVILTHAHLDHIAGLPLFIDDLFAGLREPLCIHASEEVIDILEANIFNWSIYPRFSELENDYGKVMCYRKFETEKNFTAEHLDFKPIEVNHKVPSVGFVISDEKTKIAVSGDTGETDRFWDVLNNESRIDALLIECAFPDKLDELAHTSHHLTPKHLQSELLKFKHENCPVFVFNIKPFYREQVIGELNDLKIKKLQILQVGKIYEF